MSLTRSASEHKKARRERDRRRYAQKKDTLREQRARRLAALAPDEIERRRVAQAERLRGWRQENPNYHAKYLRTYRQTDAGREVFKRASLKQRVKRRAFILAEKSKPCKDCGNSYPAEVMDFDHRDPSQKLFSIASFGRHQSIEVLKAEIEKCDVVCSNCHRIRTLRRRTATFKEVPVIPELTPIVPGTSILSTTI